MVICYVFIGSVDVSDWWGFLLGWVGRVFDVICFFIVCMNSLGSLYGIVSFVIVKDGDVFKGNYGLEFFFIIIRDDVRFYKLFLDELGVKQVVVVIGGFFGGMFVLEWVYFGKEYVWCVVFIVILS